MDWAPYNYRVWVGYISRGGLVMVMHFKEYRRPLSWRMAMWYLFNIKAGFVGLRVATIPLATK